MSRFSIVTPSFNQATFLEQAICSVLDQKGIDLEYIVLDGNSRDSSVSNIQRYADKLAYWVSESDKGQTDAIVKGWRRATGDIFAWLNSDDYYLPDALLKVEGVFRNNIEVLMVVGKVQMVDERGRVFSYKGANPLNLKKIFLGGSIPGQPAVFVHRRLIEQIGFPNPNLHYALDWEYWIRAALVLHSSQIYYLDEFLAAMRIWGGTKTSMGVEKFCVEQRCVLSDVFASGTLPESLQALQAMSLASMYVKQASLEWQAGRGHDARQSLREAIRLAPNILRNKEVHYNSLGVRLWCYIPYRLYNFLQKGLSTLRGHLHI